MAAMGRSGGGSKDCPAFDNSAILESISLL